MAQHMGFLVNVPYALGKTCTLLSVDGINVSSVQLVDSADQVLYFTDFFFSILKQY